MSAAALRLMACIFMLADHIGFVFGFLPLRIVGRLAFPIFLYLICNGFRYTSSKLKYALRLGMFALLSQVPFSLMSQLQTWVGNWNVFFTLLLSLLCIWSADRMLDSRILRWFALLPALAVVFLYHIGVFRSDYGARGIITVMVMFLLERFGVRRSIAVAVGLVAGLVYFLLVQWRSDNLTQWTWLQLFSLGAIPLIHIYNGTSGMEKAGKRLKTAAKWGFYLFYPVHMFALFLVYILK